MSKRIRNKIDGVLLLDKPMGVSSNNAILQLKRLLNADKVGHTGTLDPLATGLLPVCLGEATKFASYLLDGDKEYIATAQLGVVTDSGDSEGTIISRQEVKVSLANIAAVFEQMHGVIWQTPPMYSALKHQGRPLYEYARQGITLERPARQVEIYSLELLNYDASLQQLSFRARVSKGTYIRTLAEDIGQQLGCGASLVALRRSASNHFKLADAVTLEQLAAYSGSPAEWLSKHLLPVTCLTASLPALAVADNWWPQLRNGNQVVLAEQPASVPCATALQLFADGHFIGLGEIRAHANQQLILQPTRLLSNLNQLQIFN